MIPINDRKIKLRGWIIITVAVLIVFAFKHIAPPVAQDWYEVYKPAAIAMISGGTPYNTPGFYNPPWALIPLLPLMILPKGVDLTVFILIGLAAIGWTAYKLESNEFGIAAIILSMPTITLFWDANIDWLVVLGFALPPQIGLFFVTLKPQIGIGVAVYWLVKTWTQGGWREIIKVFGPVTGATLISFAAYGLWPMVWKDAPRPGYVGLWPWSIPVGLVLLVIALRKNSIKFAIGAGPCFATFLEFHSWIGPLMALVGSTKIIVAVVSAIWIALAVFLIGSS